MEKKRIVFITGTRADYGKLKSLMNAVEASGQYELFIFVSGMHLLPIFGNTYREITKDGFNNIYIALGLIQQENMSANLGNTITHLTGYVDNIHPDLIVVHGDRIDALAGAVVGALNNILVAHIEGGEISGTIDESIRHAVSKFAHLHFVSNIEAKRRLTQMGEQEEDIFVIGSPDIDIMMRNDLPSIDDVKHHYGIDFQKYAILMYHPVTTEHPHISANIREVVNAVIKSRKKYIVVYPNNDTGSETILNEYARFSDRERFAVFPSLRFEYFLSLLKHAEFMIGNSSAGVRETGVYGVPSIDIGSRQRGRYSVSKTHNIQHVDEREEDILQSIKQVNEYRMKEMSFGGGDSTEQFIRVLSSGGIWEKKLQKHFVDLMEIL